jgi:hypothetical protein
MMTIPLEINFSNIFMFQILCLQREFKTVHELNSAQVWNKTSGQKATAWNMYNIIYST